MGNLRKHLHSAILLWGLSLGLGSLPVVAQQVPQQTPNPDITRQELANFDRFLDTHPEIAKQLQANPSLINNPEWVENHPDLRAFLASHPGVREEIQETPRFFMERERRFENSENRPGNPNPDITRQELANFDRFLDTHPEIAKQLQANPSLINNPEWVENHPDLRAFLASHPGVREEIRETPRYFMQREQRFESTENRPADLSTREVETFDRFLDHHKDIAKELRQNPALVNDPEFVKKHKDLRSFLKNHPEVREEVRENPSRFMPREARLE